MGVCRSVFYLPKPRPLNHLVQDLFGGPTLVLQGAKVNAKTQQQKKASSGTFLKKKAQLQCVPAMQRL